MSTNKARKLITGMTSHFINGCEIDKFKLKWCNMPLLVETSTKCRNGHIEMGLEKRDMDPMIVTNQMTWHWLLGIMMEYKMNCNMLILDLTTTRQCIRHNLESESYESYGGKMMKLDMDMSFISPTQNTTTKKKWLH